ncbi:MAG TPA: hypothetical protein PLV68_10170, partial [Ilumatobacteraceae bacterium]|nr:hypothetical protein [Ilumatobacteraceae bacterium]
VHQDLAPITFVHSDFAPSYETLVKTMYRRGEHDGSNTALARNGIDASAVADARRIVILQFWRNIGPAKMDYPLGFCDARTIALDDVTAFPVDDYAGSGIDFEALGMHAPRPESRHRWYA